LNKEKGGNPPPVNITVLREGIKTALGRKQSKSDKPQKRVNFDKTALNAAVALKARERRSIPFGPAWSSTLSEESDEDDNLRYIGLEDMANLLGFDDDDDDTVAIDHAAVARRIGRGRYL
jgi:hypothetical protein